MKTAEEENIQLKKTIKWLLALIKEHEPNIDMMLYPHQQQLLNQVRTLVKVKTVKVKI